MSGEPLRDPVPVLLVEDNPGDVRLIQEGLGDGPLELHVVEDGDAALAYLRQEGAFADATPPELILLDLNLPGRRGADVLAEIKQDPELRRIPVCVVTSSSDAQDVVDAYDRHANSYVTKPPDLDGFMDAVRQIERFWFQVASRPAPA